MAVKIKLGNTPKAFAPITVKFTLPDGSESEIKATFKYRTRSQFGEFLNGLYADAGEEAPKDGKPDFKALFEKTRDKNADHLGNALEAWDLDEPLNKENLQALANEAPAGSIALMTAYSAACNEGRLGN